MAELAARYRPLYTRSPDEDSLPEIDNLDDSVEIQVFEEVFVVAISRITLLYYNRFRKERSSAQFVKFHWRMIPLYFSVDTVFTVFVYNSGFL